VLPNAVLAAALSGPQQAAAGPQQAAAVLQLARLLSCASCTLCHISWQM